MSPSSVGGAASSGTAERIQREGREGQPTSRRHMSMPVVPVVLVELLEGFDGAVGEVTRVKVSHAWRPMASRRLAAGRVRRGRDLGSRWSRIIPCRCRRC